MSNGAAPLVVWCLEDDRPGHQRQLAGLAQALGRVRRVHLCRLAAGDSAAALPAPDLILTAGRRSHWRGLRCRRRHGGKLVALMDPGLLRPLFDRCVIPEHDGVDTSERVLLSAGPLNPVLPASGARTDRGLILVGGPSRHYRWDDAHLAGQLQRLQAALPDVNWTLTSSRRTPASCLGLLRQQASPTLEVIPVEETEPAWLLQRYADCGIIWVTEDSASMIHESLSSGAAVGVLGVQQRRPSRVGAGVQRLLQQGRLLRLEELEALGTMPPAQPPLQEATRIARELSRWLG